MHRPAVPPMSQSGETRHFDEGICLRPLLQWRFHGRPLSVVIPAQAGIHIAGVFLDPACAGVTRMRAGEAERNKENAQSRGCLAGQPSSGCLLRFLSRGRLSYTHMSFRPDGRRSGLRRSAKHLPSLQILCASISRRKSGTGKTSIPSSVWKGRGPRNITIRRRTASSSATV
jgi:hypothetical protein